MPSMDSAVARKTPPPKPEDPADDSPGAKLKRLVDRKRKGRDYAEIAAAAGMSPAAFSRLLNSGIADPRISTITAILKAIGATLADYEKA